MREKEFQSRVIAELKSENWKVHHVYDSRRVGTAGFPDLAILRGRYFFVIELKVGDKKPDKDQREWLNGINENSSLYMAGLFWNPSMWADIKEFIKNPQYQPQCFFS